MLQKNSPWAVSTVLQHVVGVGGVCEEELALDGHTAALLCLKAIDQDVIYNTNTFFLNIAFYIMFKTFSKLIFIL